MGSSTAVETTQFGGDRKVGRWGVATWEQAFVARNVGRVPPWLETYHLTLLTLVWSAAILGAGFLAAGNRWWLLVSGAAIAAQYLSDLFDGAVGRYRNTGLVRWGFYMDHLLDTVFLASIGLGFAWMLPAAALPWLAAAIALALTLMAHSFLGFGATGEFRISHFGVGPTELRIGLIAFYGAVIAMGPEWLARFLPWACAGLGVALALVAFRTQRALWRADIAAR